jgi:hypothetical protein
MAKVKNPLHSLSASGRLAKTVSFRQSAEASHARKVPAPYKQKTPAQLTNQKRMRDARITFLSLSVPDRASWDRVANFHGKASWTYFFTQYQSQVIDWPNFPRITEITLR